MPTERLAAIFARVSTEEQVTSSGVPSTQTQVARLRAEAAKLGIPVEERLVVEEQHSGADLRWRGTRFMWLVEQAQQHAFTDLFVLSVDRFSRGSIWEFGEQFGYFKSAGVAVHFAEGGIPEPGPLQDIVLANMAWAAERQRATVMEASARARKAAAARGDFVPGWRAPFGWRWVEDPTRKTRGGRPVKVGLEPDPVTAPFLLGMYERLARGDSVHSIRLWLEREGVPPPARARVWQLTSIRVVLRNPTNWGERRAFRTREEKRDPSERSERGLKSAQRHAPTAPDEQFATDPTCITPIPGLTRDLALRALARLDDHGRYNRRTAVLPDAERAERGLLFSAVRCATCGYTMRVKKDATGGGWRYTCAHDHLPASERGRTVSIATSVLDRAVWGLAMQTFTDPAFVTGLLATTDERAGPQARVASLERQLADAERARTNLYKHLRRLDPDDEADARLVAGVRLDLRDVEASLTGLSEALANAQAELARAEERLATLAALRAYAAAQGGDARLATLTPLERRQALLALRAQVRVAPRDQTPRLAVVFDLRYLPGAATALTPEAARERPRVWVDFRLDAPVFSYGAQTVVTEGATPAWTLSAPPMTAADWQRAGYRDEDDYLREEQDERATARMAQAVRVVPTDRRD